MKYYVEEWRPVKGYEGRYEVSSFGRVKRLARVIHRKTCFDYRVPEIIMTLKIRKSGYVEVKLSKGTRESRKDFMVHRLVAEAFLPKRKGRDYVDHLDGDKQNNHVSNLEWVTMRENNVRAYQTGLKPRIHAGQFLKGVPGRLQNVIRRR